MFLHPYIIGDRLNTANISVRTALDAADPTQLREIARRQVVNGASALDVSAAASRDEEKAHLALLVDAASRFHVALSVDTHEPGAIRSILPCARPLLMNCYSGLMDSPDQMLGVIRAAHPLVGVVAVCINFQGSHTTPEKRVDIAHRMMDELDEAGVRPEQTIFDPVTLPSSIGPEAQSVTLQTASLLRKKFPTSGVLCAASNYSYGLWNRRRAERQFARQARDAGATVFLINALDERLCAIARGEG